MTTTWLRNARLTDGRTVDVSVADGTIATVDQAGTATDGHDLAGWLLLPAMAEPHAHLDKALTAEDVPNPKGDLMGAIDAWIAAAAAGFLTVAGLRGDPNRQLLSDLPVLQRLDEYRQIDDLEFLRMLHREGLFGEEDGHE